MAKEKLAVELHANVQSASFMVDDRLVTLDKDNPRHEVTDPALHAALLELPFLKAPTGKAD
jgi:hypothetical protein